MRVRPVEENRHISVRVRAGNREKPRTKSQISYQDTLSFQLPRSQIPGFGVCTAHSNLTRRRYMPAAKLSTIHAHFAPRTNRGSFRLTWPTPPPAGNIRTESKRRPKPYPRPPRKLTGMLKPSSPWIADLQQSQLNFLSRALANFRDCIPLPWPPCPFSLHICIGGSRGPSRSRVKEIPRASCLGFGYLSGVVLVRHGM